MCGSAECRNGRMSHVALGTAFLALCLVLLISLIGHLVSNEYCPGPYISTKRGWLIQAQTLKVFIRPVTLVSLHWNYPCRPNTNYFCIGALNFSDVGAAIALQNTRLSNAKLLHPALKWIRYSPILHRCSTCIQNPQTRETS